MKPLYNKLSFMLIIAFSFTALFSETLAEVPSNYYEENVGTIDNPYQINSLANLRWLSETEEFYTEFGEPNPHLYFIQTENIDASETIIWNDGRGFKSIGLHSLEHNAWGEDVTIRCFHGQYNGQNYVISGLHIRYTGADYTDVQAYDVGGPTIGLFGYSYHSELINIHLEDINYQILDLLNLNVWIGSLAGCFNEGLISNCSVTGNIFIEGENSNADILQGGLTGQIISTNLTCSFSKVNIFDNSESSSIIGGLVGYITYPAILTNSFFYGNIIKTTPGVQQGGLIGHIILPFPGTPPSVIVAIENCYVASTGEFVNARGIVGTVNMREYYPESLIVADTFWDIDTTGALLPYYPLSFGIIVNAIGLPTPQMQQAETYIQAGWDFDEVWAIDPYINNGYPYLQGMPPMSDSDETLTPIKSQLLSNYPNPFNPTTTIVFEMAGEGQVSIDVFNIKGQKIRTLVNGVRGAGNHTVVWDGNDAGGRAMSSGVYFYRMTSGGYAKTRKMLMLK